MQPSPRFALPLLVVAVAGCGGGGPNADFVTRAERVCQDARKQIQALPQFPFKHFEPLRPQAQMLPPIGRFFTGPGDERPVVRSLASRLRTLGDPPEDRAAWRSVLDTIDDYAAVFEREDAAALHADADTWVDSVRENRRLHDRLAATAKTFAAQRCEVL